MGHKIFISYKYADNDVRSLQPSSIDEILKPTTVRSYVDRLESYFDRTNDIYKGESDDEDLSDYSDDYIWELLKDRIYDSSVTIVMISPKMREPHRRDRSQWIPWEISFSLKEKTRNDRTSHANAVLAVILPDRNGSYEYFVQHKTCCSATCNLYNTESLFSILGNNMLNLSEKRKLPCSCGWNIYSGEHSYIKPVRWDDFILAPTSYVEISLAIKENADLYDIQKEV